MTAETQPDLFPRVDPDDTRISQLVGLLSRCEDWVTAGEIEQRLRSMTGMARFSDRLVRDLASASGGLVASGQQGYMLTKNLRRDEMEHCCNRLRSQAREMSRRADEIELEWKRANESKV